MTLPERRASDTCRIVCTSPTSTPEQATYRAKAGFTRSPPFDMGSALPQVATYTCSCIKDVIRSTSCPCLFVDSPSIKTLLHSSFISQIRLPARLSAISLKALNQLTPSPDNLIWAIMGSSRDSNTRNADGTHRPRTNMGQGHARYERDAQYPPIASHGAPRQPQDPFPTQQHPPAGRTYQVSGQHQTSTYQDGYRDVYAPSTYTAYQGRYAVHMSCRRVGHLLTSLK
jgi:hypothetical protein